MRESVALILLILIAMAATAAQSTTPIPQLDQYNAIWTRPSKHAGESMPRSGGDHAPQQTVVEGKVRGGKAVALRVTPPSRRHDMVVKEGLAIKEGQ